MPVRHGRRQDTRRSHQLALLRYRDQCQRKTIGSKRASKPRHPALKHVGRVQITELGQLPFRDEGQISFMARQVVDFELHAILLPAS
jgi:hypothetical protein